MLNNNEEKLPQPPDSERPDGWLERLIRIETRLVAFRNDMEEKIQKITDALEINDDE